MCTAARPVAIHCPRKTARRPETVTLIFRTLEYSSDSSPCASREYVNLNLSLCHVGLTHESLATYLHIEHTQTHHRTALTHFAQHFDFDAKQRICVTTKYLTLVFYARAETSSNPSTITFYQTHHAFCIYILRLSTPMQKIRRTEVGLEVFNLYCSSVLHLFEQLPSARVCNLVSRHYAHADIGCGSERPRPRRKMYPECCRSC